MRRRAFIVGLGGAAALPMVARGQQSKVWRVGYLTPASADDEVSVGLFDVFRLKLRDLGYVEGKNLRLDLRRAEGDYTRLPTLAVELVSLAPDVIAGTSSPATAALQRATSSIPIVMTAINDPIGLGFVKSLARPGGNITGLSNLSADFTAKSFELLHVAVPNAKRVAVLTSPNPLHEAVVTEAYTIAGAMGLTIVPVMARTPADLNDAFSAMNKETCDAVVVLSDPRTSRKIVELANEWRLPAIYQATGFADMGGLLTYSANFPEMFQRAAVYVDKVLRGASPADLPVEQPTRLELQVNLKTAKALGLTIPDSILVRADRVIE
jgi:putative tryptophan/tyrosine transport system substrate-binding protein